MVLATKTSWTLESVDLTFRFQDFLLIVTHCTRLSLLLDKIETIITKQGTIRGEMIS